MRQQVKCPRCGNTQEFCLTLNYLRLAVTHDPDKGYVATWDEGEADMAYCACCHAQLPPEDVSYLYTNATIES